MIKWDNLLRSVVTVDQKDELILRINGWLQTIYKKGDDALEKIILEDNMLNLIKEEINQSGSTDWKMDFSVKLSEAVEYLNSLPIVRITLAFDPPENFLREFRNEAEKQTNCSILLSFDINRSIIGGAVIEYNGKFFDQSLKTKIISFLNSQRKRLVDQLT